MAAERLNKLPAFWTIMRHIKRVKEMMSGGIRRMTRKESVFLAKKLFTELAFNAAYKVSFRAEFATLSVSLSLAILYKFALLRGNFCAPHGRNHSAVPRLGTKSRSIFAPSCVSSQIFFCRPPAYPVKLPLLPTTRWQGTMMETGLCPTAPPTA